MALTNEEQGIRILLVEDEVLMAEETTMALRAMGYPNATHSNTYEEALESVTKNPPDLLLLDIDLGDEKDRDGIHLAARIQQDHSIPVIFLTQHPVSTFRKRLKNINKVGYLTKSFNLDNLHAAIEVALDGMGIAQTEGDRPAEEDSSLSFSGDRFFLRKQHRYYCFHLYQLLYVQAHDSYCTLHFQEDAPTNQITLSINLKEATAQINHPNLYRVHRSFAINLEKLTAFEGNMLFINEQEIPVGPSYREELLSRLNILGHRQG